MNRVQKLLAMATVMAPVYAHADLEVTDSEGRPLEEAVVEIYWSSQSAAEGVRDEDDVQHRMVQRDAAFEPHVMAITAGDRVAFLNRDTTRHQIYSFSPAKTFGPDLHQQRRPSSVEFDTPGVVVLGCNIHDRMQAFIVVSDAPFYAMTDDRGRVDTDDIPAGEHRLRVWHPQLEQTHQQWWEGRFEVGRSQRVTLRLEATPPDSEGPSALQQRFRQATGQDS